MHGRGRQLPGAASPRSDHPPVAVVLLDDVGEGLRAKLRSDGRWFRCGPRCALGLLVAQSVYDIMPTHKVPHDELGETSTGTLIGEMAESIASLLKWLDSEGELRFARVSAAATSARATK